MSIQTNVRAALWSTLMVSLPALAQQSPTVGRDGQHDFDFEIGNWKTHVSRLLHPLSGSTTWAEYDGTTVVRKVWNGKANLVELEVSGPNAGGCAFRKGWLNSSMTV